MIVVDDTRRLPFTRSYDRLNTYIEEETVMAETIQAGIVTFESINLKLTE